METMETVKLSPSEVSQLEQALEEPAVASEPLTALIRQVRKARSRA